MLANWVKETTATVGAGVISLGGAVAGHLPFSAAFAGGDRVLYSIAEGTSREIGIGTLTAGAPWTLARSQVLQTLVAGVLDDSAPDPIVLAGAATVGIDMAAQAVMPELQGAPIYAGGVHTPANVLAATNSGKGGGEFTALAGRITLTPITFATPVRIAAAGAHLNTASAGGNFRVGIYAAKRDGGPGALLFDTGNLSTAATGLILGSLPTPIHLPAGHYYAADCADNVTATAYGARGTTAPSVCDSRYGTDDARYATGKRPYYDQAYGALPAVWPAASGHHGWASFGLVWR